jgi:CHAT domain-containing protein
MTGETVSPLQKLAQLVAAQKKIVQSGEASDRLQRIQTELSQMEAVAGVTEHIRGSGVLDRVLTNLPAHAALLSFRLGEPDSWLWTVYQGKLQLYRLPAKPRIQAQVREFEQSVATNDTVRIADVGRRLYLDLFGGSEQSFSQSSQWFISVDDPLLPFASLVVENVKDRPVYLAERKAFEVLPGAWMLAAPQRERVAAKRLLLAGDGIYNQADPRFTHPGLLHAIGFNSHSEAGAWSMARLPASGAEVRFAANLSSQRVVLTGAGLTKDRLLKEIDRDPAVIHIASHVLEAPDRLRTGILALGIDQSGAPDLLTAREIMMHPIHSCLVVMTGCSSGSGDVLPASGLMGLTRAWLAAGAGEVLATRWPVMDESREGLVGSFYVHLLFSPDGNIPEALRQARKDMITRGGWRAEPRYWSSFFLIGVR